MSPFFRPVAKRRSPDTSRARQIAEPIQFGDLSPVIVRELRAVMPVPDQVRVSSRLWESYVEATKTPRFSETDSPLLTESSPI